MNTKRILIFLLVILLLSILSVYYPQLTSQVIKQADYPLEYITLAKVIDGDTIKDENGQSYRLLGINTPEKKMPISNESKAFLKQFEGKNITLQRDWEDIDKYKRKLRYIFYEDRFLNVEILEHGFANTYYLSGLKYEKQLLNAETQAKNLEVGIWQKSSNVCSAHNCIILRELNPESEFFTIFNQCNIECNLDGWFVKDAGRNTFYLSNLSSLQEQTITSKENKDIWNNDGDRLFMFDSSGKLVIFYEYAN